MCMVSQFFTLDSLEIIRSKAKIRELNASYQNKIALLEQENEKLKKELQRLSNLCESRLDIINDLEKRIEVFEKPIVPVPNEDAKVDIELPDKVLIVEIDKVPTTQEENHNEVSIVETNQVPAIEECIISHVEIEISAKASNVEVNKALMNEIVDEQFDDKNQDSSNVSDINQQGDAILQETMDISEASIENQTMIDPIEKLIPLPTKISKALSSTGIDQL